MGGQTCLFSNYAQILSGSPAVQNFDELRTLHWHQHPKMMLRYISESVHFDIIDLHFSAITFVVVVIIIRDALFGTRYTMQMLLLTAQCFVHHFST